MEWNYYNTFIKVSADCPVETGTVPPERKSGPTKAGIEYELAAGRPYYYTQKQLLFEVYARQHRFTPEELSERGEELRQSFFGKPQACMRASMLPKRYGWGIHFDDEGRLAIVPLESEAYRYYAEGGDGNIRVVAGMRNRKA